MLSSEQYCHPTNMELNKEARKLKKQLEARQKRTKVDQTATSSPPVNVEIKKHEQCVSKDEIISEYFIFLRNLPVLPDFEKKKLIDLVKKEWGICEILNSSLNPEENLTHLKNGNDLLDRLSAKIGQSLRIIAPPVKNCLFCKEILSVNHKPTQIAVHKKSGPQIHSKYILRCKRCRLVEKSKFDPSNEDLRQDVFYHPDKYGNQQNGYMFYKQEVNFIKASNEVYLEKLLVESAMSNFMHGFMSMESTAEGYNETFRHSNSVKLFKEFLHKNQSIGNHFNTKIKENNSNDDIDIPLSDHFNEKEAEAAGHHVQKSMHELHRKSVVSSFYNYWLNEELKERKINYLFGPYNQEDGSVFSFKDSVEKFLEEIDELRSKETYTHEDCAGKTLFYFIS